ncbi:LOW QUALITY PROTEIN: hypothetical protein HID58_021219 [Brassica napus]|uniref:Neprosin PEP catalytic domain-containing protein n=1 Tax=Brassica napus TaxID=3708 RepID=A0ABQ8CY70_BRANA|nr:LOW QUALITY PROTEIN: hypothetical protein HID58_021219 [Brassica napus]
MTNALNVRVRKKGTKSVITVAVLLLTFCPLSACAPVLTIHSPDGDIIECINTLDQPSLNNPLLKKHVFQDYPSGMTKTEDGGFGWQVWHRNGTACPQGTVPVQRVEAEAELSQGKYGPLIPDAAERATKGHQASVFHSYAVGFVEADLPIYGTKATLNVWNPVVESADDFSLAQIWVTSGNYKHNELNTLETGWQVYPNKYGDRQARLFTYWTRVLQPLLQRVRTRQQARRPRWSNHRDFDIWGRPVRYNLADLEGIGSNTCNRQSIFTFRNFISSNMLFYLRFHPWIIWKQNFSFHFTVEEVILKASLEALVLLHEAPIVGEISGLIELLFCTLGTGLSCFDPLSGHWWLGMGLNVVPIGYWPVELFTTLSAHASKVQWGGEVLYINSTGLSNITQMGSGAFPRKGFRKAAYVCNMQIAEKNRSFLPPLDFQLGATQPDSYTAAKTHGRGPSGCGNHFYYGGPGPGPLRSSSFRSDPLAILFLFLGVYVVV